MVPPNNDTLKVIQSIEHNLMAGCVSRNQVISEIKVIKFTTDKNQLVTQASISNLDCAVNHRGP
jgi:hypothetical protein